MHTTTASLSPTLLGGSAAINSDYNIISQLVYYGMSFTQKAENKKEIPLTTVLENLQCFDIVGWVTKDNQPVESPASTTPRRSLLRDPT